MCKVKPTLDRQPESCVAVNSVNARLLTLLLFSLVLLLPLLTSADGLFDFQMKLAKDGNAEAQYKVGEMYETGFGVKRNRSEAEKWIVKSANKGHENAGFKLLYWDVEKHGLKGENKSKVKELLTKADSGNPQAQFYVGKMYAYGIGVKKDTDKAIGWLSKAALVGVLEAERELVVVREDKQQIQVLAKRRAEEKKRVELKLKAKQDRVKQADLKEQRKMQVKKDANARLEAEQTRKKKADAAALEEAKKEQSYNDRMLAKKEAEAKKRQAQKQASLKKKAELESKRKTQFESDPCSSKSARFLSTCR